MNPPRLLARALVLAPLAVLLASCGHEHRKDEHGRDAALAVEEAARPEDAPDLDGDRAPDAGAPPHASATDAASAPSSTRLAVSPSRPEFPRALLGCDGTTVTFTVRNGGDGAIGPMATKIGGLARAFSIGSDGCGGKTLAAGGSCTLAVTLVPEIVGLVRGTLSIEGDGAESVSVPLEAIVVTSHVLALSRMTADFRSIPVGVRSAPASFRLANTGGAPLTIDTVRLTGASADDFVIERDDCSAAPLPPGAACDTAVLFAPRTVGLRTATLTFSAPGCGGGTVSAILGGTAIDVPDGGAPPVDGGQARLVLSPATQKFEAGVGCTGTAQVLTVTNTGTEEARGLVPRIEGAEAADFTIVRNECGTAALAPGGRCALAVSFTPRAAGIRRGRLSVTGMPETRASAELEGVAQPAHAGSGFTPQLGSFATTTIGTRSQGITFTLTNDGGGAATIPPSQIVGLDAGSFAIERDDCSKTPLAPGASCALLVVFAPTIAGMKAAVLSLRTEGCGAVHLSAQLVGTAVVPEGTATP